MSAVFWPERLLVRARTKSMEALRLRGPAYATRPAARPERNGQAAGQTVCSCVLDGGIGQPDQDVEPRASLGLIRR